MKKSIFLFFLASAWLVFAAKDAFAMHISEGILPMKWAFVWSLVALPFLIKGIVDVKKRAKTIPNFKPFLGLMGAIVFIISCMPIPVPIVGTSSHPAGTGISAILLGPIMSIFVASIALLIQAAFLAHGGITTWGADIVSMGVAGSFAAYIAFKTFRKFRAPLFVCGFAAGIMADWATYAVTSFELASALHGSKPLFSLFSTILIAFIPTQLPLGILEGFLTGGMVVFVARRRPDILISLGVMTPAENRNNPNNFTPLPAENAKKTEKDKRRHKRFKAKIAAFLLASILLFGAQQSLFAENKTRWAGIDETIVEKIAEEHGRKPRAPFINTDQGDLLLFVFLLAGTAGGFIIGFYWRKIFVKKEGAQDASRNIQ